MSKNRESILIPELRFPDFLKLEGWIDTELGTVAQFINGRAYKQEELLDKGKYKVLRVGNFFTNNAWYYSDLELEPEKYCDNGDLLYAWSASFGPRIWAGDKTIYHYHIWKVINNKNIDRQFLYILLGHQTEKMKSQSANGFALLHITKGTIEKWKCSIPESEKEQKKIASCLSSVDEIITAESQKLEVLKEHKKGLLQNLLPQEGETVPKFRFKEFHNSGEWVFDAFSEYIKLYRGSSPRPIQNFFTTGESGVNWIKIGDTKNADNFIIKQVEERITPEGAENSRKVNIGELILANSMSFGKTYQLAIEGFIYDGWFVLREFEKHFDKLFLLQLLNSEYMQKQYKKLSAGGIVQNISSEIVYNTVLPHTSINEQKRIASCLSSLDELVSAQSQKVETLKLHKKGLLQGLFPIISNVE